MSENPFAFPRHPNAPLSDPHKAGEAGMTLRDYFAGQAVGVIAGSVATAVGEGMIAPESAPKLAATLAYDIADAMLAERNQS